MSAATQVPMPHPSLHAGQRLATSAYARHQVADYGDARAAESEQRAIKLRERISELDVECNLLHTRARVAEEALQTTIEEARSLLWNPQPQCCGNTVVGAEYMGSVELVCCGEPELDSLSDAEIVKRLREMFPQPKEAQG